MYLVRGSGFLKISKMRKKYNILRIYSNLLFCSGISADQLWSRGGVPGPGGGLPQLRPGNVLPPQRGRRQEFAHDKLHSR